MYQESPACRYPWRHVEGSADPTCGCVVAQPTTASLEGVCVLCDGPLLEAATTQPCNHSMFHFTCFKEYLDDPENFLQCPVCTSMPTTVRFKSPTTGEFLNYSVEAADIRSIHVDVPIHDNDLTHRRRIDLARQVEIKDDIFSKLQKDHPELPTKQFNDIFAQLSILFNTIDDEPIDSPERERLIGYMFQLLNLPAFPGLKVRTIQGYLNRNTEGWEPRGRKDRKVVKVLDVMIGSTPGLDMSNSLQRIMYTALQIEYDGTTYVPVIVKKEDAELEVPNGMRGVNGRYVPGAEFV